MTDPASDEARAVAARRRKLEQKIQRQLDEALAASFPASDPVSIVTSHEEEDWGTETVPPEPPGHGRPREGG
jgi:2-methylcitrate dehydratase PrpD